MVEGVGMEAGLMGWSVPIAHSLAPSIPFSFRLWTLAVWKKVVYIKRLYDVFAHMDEVGSRFGRRCGM